MLLSQMCEALELRVALESGKQVCPFLHWHFVVDNRGSTDVGH